MFLGGKGLPADKTDNLTVIYEPIPADVLGTLSCEPSNCRKRVRKVINKLKLRGDRRSEVK
jgi:hypothetical protein